MQHTTNTTKHSM